MKICDFCNNEFEPHPKNPYAVTCSKECSIKRSNRKAVESGRKKIYSKRWREKYSEQIKQRDMEYLNQWRYGGNRTKVLERDNYTCQKCEKKDVKSLIVHHIDEVIENTSMSNLVTWCNACHARHHNSGESSPSFKHISKEDIEQAINSSKDLEEAAKKLGIARCTLRNKRKIYGLPNLSRNGKPASN